jgi:hypothetical protein
VPNKKATNQSTTRKSIPSKPAPLAKSNFEQAFPMLADWVNERGWVEIGFQDDFSGAFVRALDAGGMVWEGKFSYPSLDAALRDLENGIKKWVKENG